MAGFTLFELLIAVAVFAVMSAMAYGGLISAAETGAHVKQRSEQLRALGTALHLIEDDILHSVNRPVRDALGDPQHAMVVLGPHDGLLRLTRSGGLSPAIEAGNTPRSALRRIEYRLVDGQLFRDVWPVLDRMQTSKPSSVVVLENLRQFDLRAMDANGEWQNTWPTDDVDALVAPPYGVEITFDLPPWGRIRRVVPLS